MKIKIEKIQSDLWYYHINHRLYTIQKTKDGYISRNSGNIIAHSNTLKEAKKEILNDFNG